MNAHPEVWRALRRVAQGREPEHAEAVGVMYNLKLVWWDPEEKKLKVTRRGQWLLDRRDNEQQEREVEDER